MDRRELLRLVGVGGVLSTAGCFGTEDTTSTDQAPDESPPTGTDTSRVRQWAREADTEGPVRPTGDPVSVEETLSDEPGYEDGFEYFPGNRTVRVVTTMSGGEPTGFESRAFDEWGHIESVEVGAERAAAVTARRLEVDRISHGLSRPPPRTERDGLVIRLELSKTLDSEGNVEQWPVATLPDLTRVAPRSVEVTLSLAGDTVTQTIPVYAQYVILREM
jgi:hypothetical protein